jgi:hypothetical protein
MRRTGSLGWSARKALVLHPMILPQAAAAADGLEGGHAAARPPFLGLIAQNFRQLSRAGGVMLVVMTG